MKKAVKQISKYKRPSWNEYFISLANFLGSRGTCDRNKSGCVIVRDKKIVSTGYVGSPPGLPHCDEVGHEINAVTNKDGTKSLHCVRTIHAEQNAISQAAKFGISVDGGTLYLKLTPCYTCAKNIIAAGIKRVVSEKDYHTSQKSKEIFKRAGVKLVIINNTVEQYKDM